MNRARVNPIGIQMISDVLHRRIYGNRVPTLRTGVNVQNILEQLKKSIENVQFANNATNDSNKSKYPFEEFLKYLPLLKNNDVLEHVQWLGEHFSAPYLNHVYELLKISPDHIKRRPTKWSYKPGWTRYSPSLDGTLKPESVDYPLEDAIVFDVEISMEARNKNKPTLAVALTPQAWYSWTSEALISFCESNNAFSFVSEGQLSDMIPLGGNTLSSSGSTPKRLIVGHNVSFDRSYIQEQYFITPNETRFLDTMSLHIAVSGLIQEQKIIAIRSKSGGATESDKTQHSWSEVSSLNNLADVYQLYCKPKKGLDKDSRDIFVKGTMKDVQDNFQKLTEYCANDVAVTLKVLQSLFPLFFSRFPNPVTFSGMLEMNTMYLPTNAKTWKRYVYESQSLYEEYKDDINKTLKDIACDSCGNLIDSRYKKDPWLWDMDWSTKEIGFKKIFYDEISNYENYMKSGIQKSKKQKIFEPLHFSKTYIHMRKIQPHLPGYPQWFLEFCEGNKTLQKASIINFDDLMECNQMTISPKLRVIPKLLKLTWKGFPLHYDNTWGWGFLVPMDYLQHHVNLNAETEFEPLNEIRRVVQITEADIKELVGLKGIEDLVPGCLFYKLPHKSGPDKRVGNPLGKDFLPKIADGTLKPFNGQMSELVNQQNLISYWTNSSKRILSQMHISYDNLTDDGAILPRVIVAGTVTRRAVEPTWLTASNSYKDRLGSELKGIIQCPPGYSYVGADVDSQELWIASLIGDAHFSGIQGSTGLGWMTLRGERSLGTDMHSVTANSINITRDEAKVLNYARIYGSGKEFAARFLKQSDISLSDEEAKKKAKKIFAETKGTKYKKMYECETGLIISSNWVGGTESHMFNRLEEIATSPEPRTPFLKGRISRALEPSSVGNDYMTSRINWVVQSSAVDFLHILLLSMKWLFEEFKIDGRFSISIHDEIRYIVKDKHIYKAALALQLSNLITRAYFTAALELNDLPASVAFFSSIEIDRCIRKDVNHDCITPSNPLGLSKGYGIAAGQSLDISSLLDILEKESNYSDLQVRTSSFV